MSILNLEDTPAETHQIESKDIILIKESISAALCRIVGIEHPLHNLGEDNIILTQDDEEICSYRFKDDPDSLMSGDF